jgi:hypothetical protein
MTAIIAAGGHCSNLQGGDVPLRSYGHRRVHDWQAAGDLGLGFWGFGVWGLGFWDLILLAGCDRGRHVPVMLDTA